jgi:hypothetical protein
MYIMRSLSGLVIKKQGFFKNPSANWSKIGSIGQFNYFTKIIRQGVCALLTHYFFETFN